MCCYCGHFVTESKSSEQLAAYVQFYADSIGIWILGFEMFALI